VEGLLTNSPEKMNQASIAILLAGPQTILVDGGRKGHNRLGITASGPSDPYAFDIANRICGNPQGACAIEIIIGGVELLFLQSMTIAVTGAEVTLFIDDKLCECWRSYTVKKGQTVSLSQVKKGLRVYLAVSGWVQVPSIFGSASTVLREGLGGLKQDGQRLISGDHLFCQNLIEDKALCLPVKHIPEYSLTLNLRVIAGFQFADFADLEVRRFLQHQYSVSTRMDKMGVRLEGASVRPPVNGILSEGICLGSIQIPPDGQPIIMMQDHQTIGGYPKLGSLFSLDCGRLSQAPPGTKVCFELLDMMTAHNLLHLSASKIINLKAIDDEI
jgi:biotin-dependent carboxylase-like uncharacterized protein